jgi:indolepyruvate ferredoxin oxidoreductase, beta subunit
VVIAGLGGQGVITASDILADAAFRAGLDVKKAEIHGMAQRGGSVSSDVRFGPRVLSPMVPAGEADFLLVLAATQVDVSRAVLKPRGILFTADAVPHKDLADRRTANVALLGVLSRHLAIPESLWIAALDANLPMESRQANHQAFAIGRNQMP